jgi:hypothetical protein
LLGWRVHENIGVAAVNPRIILFAKIKELFPWWTSKFIYKFIDIIYWFKYPIIFLKRKFNKVQIEEYDQIFSRTKEKRIQTTL